MKARETPTRPPSAATLPARGRDARTPTRHKFTQPMHPRMYRFIRSFSAAPIPPLYGEGGRRRRTGGVCPSMEDVMANERARALRKTMTPQEVKLWVHLRRLRPQGLHFRRQPPLEGYILDFVCFKHRLIVEVDGSQHGEAAGLAHDAKRDAHFAAQGFHTLRVWNHEVDANIESVVETIIARARESISAETKGVRHG
jgi:very-short-patch-repair endonuclease